MFPPSFMAEIERQRRNEIAALEHRLAGLRARPSDSPHCTDVLGFEPGDPNFERAARVAIQTLHSCDSIERVTQVRLRPYDSKFPGAWRVEASYTREGPYSGAEAYLSSEQLIAIWKSGGPEDATEHVDAPLHSPRPAQPAERKIPPMPRPGAHPSDLAVWSIQSLLVLLHRDRAAHVSHGVPTHDLDAAARVLENYEAQFVSAPFPGAPRDGSLGSFTPKS